MGLLTDGFDFGDTFGGLLPSATGIGKAFSGELGADASRRSAAQQAEQFRRIFELFKPFSEAGIDELDGLKNSAGQDGFFGGVGSILSQPGVQEVVDNRFRDLNANLAATGTRRSGFAGKQAANIANDVALPIEAELNRRRQRLAGIGQDGTRQQSNALGGLGEALAGGALGVAQSGAQGASNAAGLIGSILGLFSDERLKDDIKIVNQLGDLDVISWTWNEDAENKLGLKGESIGFSAQNVRKKYPEYTSMREGYLTVNMPGLLKELEVKYGTVQ